MADCEASRKERGNLKRKFTRTTNNLTRLLDEGISGDIVLKKFLEAEELWIQIQNKHDEYVSLCVQQADNADQTDLDCWLDEVESAFLEIQMRVLSHSKDEESGKVQKQIKSAEGARKIEEVAFVSLINSVHELSMKNTMTKGQIVDLKTEIKEHHDRCQSRNKALMEFPLSESQESEVFQLTEKFQKSFLGAQEKLNQILETMGPEREKSNGSRLESGSALKLERMKMPKFDGDIREYPRFKSDFLQQIQPEMKDSRNSAYVLKTCLTGPAADVVRNVDDDIAEMWNRLDIQYGRPSKLADIIINEIKNLRSIQDGDAKHFIELVDVVERGYKDLTRIAFEHEISNSAVVSLIEERLPLSIQIKWAERVNAENSEVDEKDKFPALLKFMLEQKRVSEYVGADLRRRAQPTKAHSYFTDVVPDTVDGEDTRKSQSQGRCILHKTNNHTTENCRDFRAMSDEEKEILSFSPENVGLVCDNITDPQSVDSGPVDGCSRFHHEILHNAHEKGIGLQRNSVMIATESQKREGSNCCLLQMMTMPTISDPLNVLWDSGATVSLITFQKAETLGLEGKPLTMTIGKVGGEIQKVKSSAFTVPLLNERNEIVEVKAYGIEAISSELCPINIQPALDLFKNVTRSEVHRPSGKVDLLIGMDYAGFHPVTETSRNHLLLMKNQFGYCLGGTHPMLEERTKKLIQTVTVHHVQAVKIDEFFQTENLGVSCFPKCGGCKCGKCQIGGKDCTIQEERERVLIDKGLTFIDGQWTASYPWIKDPHLLPDNFAVAFAKMLSTERRLSRHEQHANLYNGQVADMLERNVAKKLSQKDLDSYQGPVHYISHHDVLNPDSESTPCRIVFNASANFKGHVLNDYWAKGPDLLNNLLGILLRFRENLVVLMGDIRKMYHAVKLSELDQHTHRFLWRFMDKSRPPDIFAMTSVSFGDKPAGNIAITALHKTAELFKDRFPEAAEMIIKNSYVDDIVESIETREEANSLMQQANVILGHASFAVKSWTVSPNGAEHDGSIEKVLGVLWNTATDCINFKFKLNFSPKIRKQPSSSDLTEHDIPVNIPKTLTKRMVLSQLNGVFDPLGLCSPVIVKAKILMRKLHTKRLDWDDSIGDEERKSWISVFSDLFQAEKHPMPRCVKPQLYSGDPEFIFFSDASEQAYRACVYVRYALLNGSFASRLLMSKTKLAPVKKISIVRLELCGALISARIKVLLEKEMRIELQNYCCLVDSKIVQAMIQKESYGFKTFVALRIGEIQESTRHENWFWLEGYLNIADVLTRGEGISDEEAIRRWQYGPSFLSLPRELWPIESNVSELELPERNDLSFCMLASEKEGYEDTIPIERYSSYLRLLRITARVLKIREGRSLLMMWKDPTAKDLENAQAWWVENVQRDLIPDLQKGKFKRLGVTKDSAGTIFVGARVRRRNELTSDGSSLVLLPHKHRFSRLLVEYKHSLAHSGVVATMAKVRLQFWIVGLRRIAKCVVLNCVKCREARAELASQKMGELPVERLRPAPAWKTSFVDFFGPILIREVNKRSRGKVYGVIFSCSVSRAVHIDLANDYSTSGFLMVLRRFSSLRGYPAKIISDPGSQLVSADETLNIGKELAQDEKIQGYCANNGVEWQFISADAPWQNGCSEALVKSAKRAIKHAIGSQVLSFSELQTTLFEAAELLNERPIGYCPSLPEDEPYLSPNHLLLGRASARIPHGEYEQQSNVNDRYRLVQSVVSSFWKRWVAEYFPKMIIRQKWHTEKRNVKVGDVVLVQEQGLTNGKWQLAKVSEVFPGDDGRVRNVAVHYKNLGDTKYVSAYFGKGYTTIRRPVQRLVVLVPVEEQQVREAGSVSVENAHGSPSQGST